MLAWRSVAAAAVFSSRRATLVRKFHTPRNLLLLKERGLIQDIFPKESGHDLASHLQSAARCVYAGFDPTADSLHIGNLLIVSFLLHAHRAGHKAIAVVGGSTARIGDPSGKSSERPALSAEQVQKNAEGIKNDLTKIFSNHDKYFGDGKQDPSRQITLVNNLEWYTNLNLLDFLSSTGRHFRLGRMLTRQVVKARIDSEEGMSLTEFAYQVFQAYDWLMLHERYGCTVQIGGSDQMGNIHAGHELISRVKDEPVFGITLPLITSETGDKMGKSAPGVTVWLSAHKYSPFDFYQYFVRLPDAQAVKLLPLLSFLSVSEVGGLLQHHGRQPERRLPQHTLAEQLTLLVHGEDGLRLAKAATGILYENDASALAKLSLGEVKALFENAAYMRLLLSAGMSVLDLALKMGCFHTESDAVRIISAGGFYINQVREQNVDKILMPGQHILPNQTTLVRVGKRNYYIVDWS